MQHSFRFVCILAMFLMLGLCRCTTGGGPQAEAAPADAAQAVIPFVLTEQNNIVVKAMLNDVAPLDLMLHTAATDVALTEDAVSRLATVKFDGADAVKSWGGQAESRYSSGNRLRIAGLQRDNVTVWEVQRSGVGTDGKVGLDFFDGRVVEIDFARRQILLYDRLPRKAIRFAKVDIERDATGIFVPADLVAGGKTRHHRFLLHTGYSGGVLLDDEFVAASGIGADIRITGETKLFDSFGREIAVKKGIVPFFDIGGVRLADVPAGFFAGAVGAQKASVVGGGILKRLDMIFDLAGNHLYVHLEKGKRDGGN